MFIGTEHNGFRWQGEEAKRYFPIVRLKGKHADYNDHTATASATDHAPKKSKGSAAVKDGEAKSKKHMKDVTDSTTTYNKVEVPVASESTTSNTVNEHGENLKVKHKLRKQAADFLSDTEDYGADRATRPSITEQTAKGESSKIKKTKSKKSKESGDDVDINIVSGVTKSIVEKIDEVDAGKNNLMGKKKQNQKQSHKAEKSMVPPAEISPSKVAKKRGASTADIAAERLKNLLSTPVRDWPDKRKKSNQAKKAQAQRDRPTLTADGVNGVNENDQNELLETAANEDAISTSMQEEAQLTTEKELEDEWASEDGNDDQGAALLAGFDSDGEDVVEDQGFDMGLELPKIPKKARKQVKRASNNGNDEGPGTVYVG